MSLNPNLQFILQNDFVKFKRLIVGQDTANPGACLTATPTLELDRALITRATFGGFLVGVVFSCVGCVNMPRWFVVFARATFNASSIGG